MFLSVAMSVYNAEKFVEKAIESVLAQTYKNFEFIILDDGSTDDSAIIINKYAAKDNRIKPIFNKNGGRPNAVNYMISIANGDLCALLDHDDEMMPNRLEKQLAFHLANPEIGATSCHSYFINDKGQLLGTQRHPALRSVEEGRKALDNNDIIHCAITGLMVKKEAFLKVGGLRKAFLPCDDVDFFNRFMEAGYTLIIIQDILMKYRLHPNSYTEREPLHIFDTIGYVGYCNTLRRTGQAEISFEAFMAIRKTDSNWLTFNRKRYNYSQIYFRRAAYEMMSRNYIHSMWQFFIAAILSPTHVFKKVLVLTNKKENTNY